MLTYQFRGGVVRKVSEVSSRVVIQKVTAQKAFVVLLVSQLAAILWEAGDARYHAEWSMCPLRKVAYCASDFCGSAAIVGPLSQSVTFSPTSQSFPKAAFEFGAPATK